MMSMLLKLGMILAMLSAVNLAAFIHSREYGRGNKSFLITAIVTFILAIAFPLGSMAILKDCNGCGYEYFKYDMPDYCEKCGHALIENAAEKFVCSCGAVYYSDGSEKFCTECGNEITYKSVEE